MHLSQGSLNESEKCLRALQYKFTRRKARTESPPLLIGNGYHKGLETKYLNPDATLTECVEAGHLEMYALIEQADHVKWTAKFADAASCEAPIEHMLTAYWDQQCNLVEHHGWTVLAVESDWRTPDAELVTPDGEMVERVVKCDLVLQSPEGWVYGVDHKSASKMWDRYKHLPRVNNQAPFYMPGIQAQHPDAPGHGFMFDIMTLAGKFERRISPVELRHVEATNAKARQVLSLISLIESGMEMPANTSGNLCKPAYCDWFDVCPHGAALE